MSTRKTLKSCFDCPHCGAKNKDLQAWYDGQYDEKKLSHEDKIKRIRDAGLPARIEG